MLAAHKRRREIQIGPYLGISPLIGDAGSGDKSTRTHREVHDKQ
jgi:hypothetical protein